jgi:thiol-disulfide isomerase/thioredoxin
MKPFLAALVLSLTLPANQPPQEIAGTLEPELAAGERFAPLSLEPVAAGADLGLPGAVPAGSLLFEGKISWHPDAKNDVRAVYAEPKEGDPVLWADADRDGKLTEGERFVLTSPKGPIASTAFKTPWTSGPFRTWPLRVLRIPAPGGDTPRVLASLGAHLQGTVDVAGRKTLVRYSIEPDMDLGQIDPKNGELGIDLDGNGTIDSVPGSPEVDLAFNETPVFRVGETYVSVHAIDPAAGRITLRTHPAADYRRIELTLGSVVPDFAFEDFEGKARKLSEFRGKHVLLDFWATWCVPCVQELPTLREAHEKYRARGFEIVGIDRDDDLSAAKAMVGGKKLAWPQATKASTDDLVLKRFRIKSIPVTVLLDPDGKVVSIGAQGQPGLRGRELEKTLDTLLPAK